MEVVDWPKGGLSPPVADKYCLSSPLSLLSYVLLCFLPSPFIHPLFDQSSCIQSILAYAHLCSLCLSYNTKHLGNLVLDHRSRFFPSFFFSVFFSILFSSLLNTFLGGWCGCWARLTGYGTRLLLDAWRYWRVLQNWNFNPMKSGNIVVNLELKF